MAMQIDSSCFKQQHYLNEIDGYKSNIVSQQRQHKEEAEKYKSQIVKLRKEYAATTRTLDAVLGVAGHNVTTTPVPLKIRLDAVNKSTPFDFWSVVNMKRTIGVDTPQKLNGVTYDFYSLSDGGSRYHNIDAPPSNTTYVANFWKRPAYGTITANPNPVQLTGGSNTGVTTIFWSSGETGRVEVHADARAILPSSPETGCGKANGFSFKT